MTHEQTGNSTDGLYGPGRYLPWDVRLSDSDAEAMLNEARTRAPLPTPEQAVMLAQRILAKSGHLSPTPEQSKRIRTRIWRRLGWMD